MSFFNLLLTALFILFMLVVGIANAGCKVPFYFLWWHWEEIPLILLLIEAMSAGMLFTIILAGIHEIYLRKTIRKLKRENDQIKSEIRALKNLPLLEAEEETREEEEEENKENKLCQ